MDRRELEKQTGLDARMIRYLIAEGIVPPPVGSGRGATYDTTHLQAINQYQQLRSEGVTSITAIRNKVSKNAPIKRVLEIAPGLELHFSAQEVSYQEFLYDPTVLQALETLKNAITRKS